MKVALVTKPAVTLEHRVKLFTTKVKRQCWCEHPLTLGRLMVWFKTNCIFRLKPTQLWINNASTTMFSFFYYIDQLKKSNKFNSEHAFYLIRNCCFDQMSANTLMLCFIIFIRFNDILKNCLICISNLKRIKLIKLIYVQHYQNFVTLRNQKKFP